MPIGRRRACNSSSYSVFNTSGRRFTPARNVGKPRILLSLQPKPDPKGFKMRYLKYLALLGVFMLAATAANAQVRVAVGIGSGYYGPAPACAYGYYDYYPYACAPYGYYGPDYFVGGVFIGAGPWYHGYYDRGYGYGRGYYGRDYGYYGRGYYGRDWDDRRFCGGRDGDDRGRFRGGRDWNRGGRDFRGGRGNFNGGRGGNFNGGRGDFGGRGWFRRSLRTAGVRRTCGAQQREDESD